MRPSESFSDRLANSALRTRRHSTLPSIARERPPLMADAKNTRIFLNPSLFGQYATKDLSLLERPSHLSIWKASPWSTGQSYPHFPVGWRPMHTGTLRRRPAATNLSR